ncbi:hypothetical protein T08_5096 [Trichinella sp. T8]|nr:hypothetical protein T08_5096 [Trichinella sp. T8]
MDGGGGGVDDENLSLMKLHSKAQSLLSCAQMEKIDLESSVFGNRSHRSIEKHFICHFLLAFGCFANFDRPVSSHLCVIIDAIERKRKVICVMYKSKKKN